jgi:5-methylcytosine-specific restriction endonuclease McrA
LDSFIEAYVLANQGKLIQAIETLKSTRSEDLRQWFVEHGQMSGWHHRVKTLAYGRPKKFKGKLETNKRIAPFEDEVYARDGYRCRYCQIRVVDFKALKHMEKLVGSENFKAAGKGNKIRHGISLTFRATADHVVPISHGGRTSIDNLVTSCWNCNYGKYNALLEQMNVENPFKRQVQNKLKWDGTLANVQSPSGQVVLCKTPNCKNAVAKQGRTCDPCYLKLPGGHKSCPRCQSIIHIKQRECAKHMLDAKGGVTRRKREPIPTKMRKDIYQRDSYTCVLCGVIGEGKTHAEKIKGFEIDHIKPNAAGGDSSIQNLQILCRKCNNSKRHYRMQ